MLGRTPISSHQNIPAPGKINIENRYEFSGGFIFPGMKEDRGISSYGVLFREQAEDGEGDSEVVDPNFRLTVQSRNCSVRALLSGKKVSPGVF